MKQHDLIVIGGGPGGYVAAIRAAQLGLNVACVDENAALGGTCLRVGCIPSKALLESSHLFAEARDRIGRHGVSVSGVELDLAAMIQRKDETVQTLTQGVASLFRKHGIAHCKGHGSFVDAHEIEVAGDDGKQKLEARHIIVATGSTPASLPGVEMDGDRIGTSTEALGYREVPPHLVVIGAGYIGLELGSVWARLGSKVTVLEYLDRILAGMDDDLAAKAHKLLAKQGLDFKLSTKVTGARAEKKGCVVEVDDGGSIKCDRVLVAVGRKPNTSNLGLGALGIELDDKGRIPIDEHFATRVEGVYAIGDVVRGPMLAHKAEEEGVACVEHIVNGFGHVNYDAIPAVVYTHPEIASVGRTETQLKESGIEYRKGLVQFRSNPRARCLDDTDGWVKVLADARTDRLLGVHIIGPRAGDLIAEAVAAIEFGASSEDLARCCHPHPSLSEALKEAALAVADRSISA